MAGSPRYKVYRNGEYVASVKHLEDAAALVSLSGGVVKLDHSRIIWTEGQEDFPAGESYDRAAEIMRQRELVIHRKHFSKVMGTE